MTTTLLFDGVGRPFRRVQVQKPDLAPGETWVRINLTALCRSDLHTYRGRRIEPTPTILGHEMIGVVEESLSTAEVGSRITWGIAASCGSCFFCRKGLTQKCESLFKYGHTESEVKGKCSGGLATHILLRRGTPIFELPEELTDEVAVLANCAGATAAATIRVAGPQTGDVVAVLGAGVLGVTTIAMLADLGCHVLVFDPIEENAQRSLRFGAFRAFSRIDQLREEVQRLTNGRGADLCFELSGVKMSAEFSLNLVRIGGKIVWAGSTTPLGGIDLSPEILVRKLLTITGIHNYTEPDLAYAVAFLARTRNEWPFQSLIAKTLSLNDIEKAFVLAEKFPGARILVRP